MLLFIVVNFNTFVSGQQALRTACVLKYTSSLLSSSLRWKACSKICSTLMRGLTGKESSPQKGLSHSRRSSEETTFSLQLNNTTWNILILLSTCIFKVVNGSVQYISNFIRGVMNCLCVTQKQNPGKLVRMWDSSELLHEVQRIPWAVWWLLLDVYLEGVCLWRAHLCETADKSDLISDAWS